MRKLFLGLSGGAWGVLIGKWMRERASVLEVEETANVVFAFSEEAGSGEPNPGLRPRKGSRLLTKEDGRGLTWTLCLQSRRLELSPLMDALV